MIARSRARAAPDRHIAPTETRAPAVRGLPARQRPLIMAVVNVTPDSFSDGGDFEDHGRAVEHALELIAEGADLIDVGGESTRPGAARTPADIEQRRVLPVVAQLARQGVIVSVDTMRSDTAASAIAAGAAAINDVSAGLADPQMVRVVADAGVPYIITHWRRHAHDMQGHGRHRDVVSDVTADLQRRAATILDAGVAGDQLILDPGIGYAKTAEQNWTLLTRIDQLLQLGLPTLVGVSRKQFLGDLLSDRTGSPRPARDRDHATAALTALLSQKPVWAFRTHTVTEHRDAIEVALRLPHLAKGNYAPTPSSHDVHYGHS